MPIQLPDDSIGTDENTESFFKVEPIKEEIKPLYSDEQLRLTPIQQRWRHELAVCDAAMDSDKGVMIECETPKAALALRMQLYRMRREMRKLFADSYNDTFDILVFVAEDSKVLIKKRREVGKGYVIEAL